jgi:hypothetical protein
VQRTNENKRFDGAQGCDIIKFPNSDLSNKMLYTVEKYLP